jgi:hypothetical protein
MAGASAVEQCHYQKSAKAKRERFANALVNEQLDRLTKLETSP